MGPPKRLEKRFHSAKSQHNTITGTSKSNWISASPSWQNRYVSAGLRGPQSLPNDRSNLVRENYFRELKRSNTRRRYVLMSQAKHVGVSSRLTIVGSVYTGLYFSSHGLARLLLTPDRGDTRKTRLDPPPTQQGPSHSRLPPHTGTRPSQASQRPTQGGCGDLCRRSPSCRLPLLSPAK